MYWLPLYGVLEAAGFQVSMVNGKQTRNLPGRKSDMKDCQWGATLHAHGLLHAGFVPPAQIRRLQDYLRLRADHLTSAAACVQHQQKALERIECETARCDQQPGGTQRDQGDRSHSGRRTRPGPVAESCAMCGFKTRRRSRLRSRCGAPGPRNISFALRQAVENWQALPTADCCLRPADGSGVARDERVRMNRKTRRPKTQAVKRPYAQRATN